MLLTTQYLDEADELADRDRGARRRADRRRGHARTSSSARVPGGHVRLRFADRAELDAAARLLARRRPRRRRAGAARPGDGSVGTLRALLDRLDGAAVEVDDLTIHTPDLDDVFFALTGTEGSRR